MASPLEHAGVIQQAKLLHSSTLSPGLESHNGGAKLGYVKDHFEKQLPGPRYSERNYEKGFVPPPLRARGQVLVPDGRSCLRCSVAEAQGRASSPTGCAGPAGLRLDGNIRSAFSPLYPLRLALHPPLTSAKPFMSL